MTERKTVTREELAAALHESGLPRDSGYLRLADAIFAALPESADEGLREALEDVLRNGSIYHDVGAIHERLRVALAATLPEPGEGS